MQRNIDIGQLRTFLAVVEHKNMTYAATLRNMTQSAVSQQIKRLEAVLDSQLVIRNANGLALTSAGEVLLPKALAMVRANDETMAAMLNTVTIKDVRLGVPQDIVSSLLPTTLATFHKAYPDVHITLVSASSRTLEKMLKDGKVDLALTTDRQQDEQAKALFRKRLIWIGAIGGAAHKKTPLPIAVGHESCPFRQAASAVLSNHATAWRAVTQVGSLEPVVATLIADIAIAPFLAGTLPHGTEEIAHVLPQLPDFYLHLRGPVGALSAPALALWAAIETGLEAPENPIRAA